MQEVSEYTEMGKTRSAARRVSGNPVAPRPSCNKLCREHSLACGVLNHQVQNLAASRALVWLGISLPRIVNAVRGVTAALPAMGHVVEVRRSFPVQRTTKKK